MSLPSALKHALRRLSFAVTLAIAVLSASGPATRADDWLPITPEELKMTGDPKAPGAPAIYLYRQVDRRDVLERFGRLPRFRNRNFTFTHWQ